MGFKKSLNHKWNQKKMRQALIVALQIEMHGELKEKATTEELLELQQTRPTEETIEQIIKEEIEATGTTMVRPTEGITEEEGRDRWGEIANKVMDIESRKNKIIIYQVDGHP